MMWWLLLIPALVTAVSMWACGVVASDADDRAGLEQG